MPQEVGGKSKPLEELLEEVKNGATNKTELFMKYGATYVRIYKGIAHAIDLMAKPKPYVPRRPLTVVAYWGKAGTGKTFACQQHVMSENESMWIADMEKIHNGWYDGYQGEKYVLLDDFRGDVMKPHVLLNLIDNHDAARPIKGGYVPFSPEYLFITSPDHPINWWPQWTAKSDNNWAQLKRRISFIYHCEKDVFDEHTVKDVTEEKAETFKEKQNTFYGFPVNTN